MYCINICLSSLSRKKDNEEGKKKISFIEQANKRKECDKLAAYIMSIDLMLNSVLHQLVVNSMTTIQDSISQRLAGAEEAKQKAKSGKKKKVQGKGASGDATGASAGPPALFVTEVVLDYDKMSFSPNKIDFENGMEKVVNKLEETVLCLQPLVMDPVFFPFTRPVLYGKQEDIAFKNGPSLQNILENDLTTKNQISEISKTLQESFDMGSKYLENLDETRRNYQVNETTDLEKYLSENPNIDFFRSLLADFKDQQVKTKNITEFYTIGIFKLNFIAMKRKALPAISRCIDKLYSILPKLARNKMDLILKECHKNKTRLDFEPKTSSDFVDNLDLLDTIEDTIKDLKERTLFVDDLFTLMSEYSIPLSGEDSGMLSTIKSSLESLSTSTETKKTNKDVLLAKFQEELSSEVAALKENILNVTQEIESPALLDPESAYEEIKQTLERLEKSIEQVRQKALQFEAYEEKFEFPTHEYPEIDDADFNLYHLNLLWDSMDKWDTWFQNITTMDFNQVSAQECKKIVKQFTETVNELNAKDEPNEVLSLLENKVTTFKSKIPCIEYLRTPQLKDRHWSAIEHIAGDDISHGVTLEFIEDRGVFDKASEIKKVCDKAKAEGKLEDLMTHLEGKWSKCSIKTENKLGCNIIVTFAPIWILISESIEIIKVIGNSIHSTTLKPKLMEWSEKIDLMETSLDRLEIIQNLWLDLEPVATTNDIKWYKPFLFKSYDTVSEHFKKILEKVTQEPDVVKALTKTSVSMELDDVDDMFQQFGDAMQSFLDPKRAHCPRLYFISDKEMIALYRDAYADIKKTEPYLRKMFKAVHELVLSDEPEDPKPKLIPRYNPLIVGFKSVDGEYVKFHRVMKARGQIEEWIKFLDHYIKTTLTILCRELKAKAKLRRRKFEDVLDDHKYPYQVTTIVAHYLWCEEMASLSKKGISQVIIDVHTMKKRLTNRLELLTKKIDCVDLIERKRAICKIQHLMYCVEYLEDYEDDRTEEIIRYAWDIERNEVQVQIDNDTFQYGFEYVGLNPIFQPYAIGGNPALAFKMALKYNLIIDTSEMHTLNKLSRVFGTNVKTILCNNPNMTLKIQHHLVGSSMSGSWINLKNLDSVNSKDLTKVFQIMQRLRNSRTFGSRSFQYNNREIRLLPTCQMIMNNENIMGNLKFFGRPVYFEESDEKTSLKFALLQKGCASVDTLDVIYNVVNDCIELGVHGVFNRMIKSLIESESAKTSVIISNFLRMSNFEKKENKKLIKDICINYLPEMVIPDEKDGSFDHDPNDELNFPSVQIYDAFKTHRFIGVEGDEQGVGKTYAIQSVLKFKAKQGRHFLKVHPLSFGAKTILPSAQVYTVSEIMGSFLDEIKDKGGTIHFCGSIDKEWKSCLETITNDSPYMLLENGEYATLPENVNFIFEVDDLENELPENIVEQVTLISVVNKKMEISHKIFTNWLNDLTLIGSEDVIKGIIRKNLQKFHSLFCKALGLLQKNFPSMLAPRFISAAISLIRFYNGYIEIMRHCEDETDFIRVFLYSLTWSFSGYILNHDREKFMDMLKDEVELSGYFTAEIEWDFLDGKMKGEDRTITPWEDEAEEMNYDKEEMMKNYVSVNSHEIAMYLILHNIQQNRHCILLGPSGTGKSTVLAKVVENNAKVIFKDRVEFWMTTSTTSKEVEELIVEAMKRRVKPYKILLVLYNVDCNNIHHLELARSLCEGRNIYIANQKRWIELTDITVCVESSTQVTEETPELLTALVSKASVICLEDNFKELEQIFTELLTVFFEDDLGLNIQGLSADVAKLVVAIYKDALKISNFFNRHCVMRCLRGIMKGHPERVNSRDTVLQLVHLELFSEFKDCLVHDHLKKMYVTLHKQHFKEIFGVESDRIDFYDTKYILMFKIDEEELSDEEEEEYEEKKEMHFVENEQLVEILEEAYPKIRGKLNLSSYDEKIVFSSDYKQYFINFLRALDSDQDVILIGETGVGKRSLARFSTLFMGLELITMDAEDCDWKEIFRQALLDASRDIADMIIVLDPEYVEMKEVLATISDIRAYGFSWNLITDYERKELLYADHEDPFMSLFSKAKYEEMDKFLVDKVNHNLNFVLCMEDQTAMENMIHDYPFISMNCIVNYYTPWTDDTMICIAEDRFEGLDTELPVPIRNVSRTSSHLHQMCRESYDSTTSSQYLEFVALFPEMYRDVKSELLKTRDSLRIGIDQTLKAQSHIDRLNSEIAAKEPDTKRLMHEAEQLNKRLAQERLNLEKASQSFRKKEAKARAKSELTQELAAETHQNLEQALPHLEASMQAINSIDKNEIAEMRAFKQPPELVLNVLEAVCILLGVKPDWPTAKNLISDPSLIQQLVEYDKDNLSDAILKRIRRYIENPKFIPEEVGKVSRACCSLCMWVRAIDYYAKIFKTIEPKRIKLLQAESELAEAMASLRKETDRVTHIESTITNIQASFSDKLKKKSALESHIGVLNGNLERAEQLAYSLEEEHRKWQEQLLATEKRLSCLVGDCLIGGMVIAYGGQFDFSERKSAIDTWKDICEQFRIPVSKLGILEVFEPIIERSYLRADTLPSFDYYQENCLIVQKSKKWILFEDPDNLADTWIHQAEKGSTIVTVDLYDPTLVRKCKLSLNKGHIFFIDNFNKDYPPELEKLIEYEIYERLRVFVGLIGIPEKKKELKVKIGPNEVTVHPKFKLYLRAESVEYKKDLQEFLKIVNFKMSSELFETHMLKCLINIDNPKLEEQRSLLRENALERKDQLENEKDKILTLLFKAQGALLDDEDLIGNITDAKASVVQATNAQKNADEASESLESAREEYLPLIKCFTQVYIVTESFKKLDPIYYFDTDSDYFDILSKCWEESRSSDPELSVPERVKKVVPASLSNICEFIVNALHSSHKIPFLLLFVIKAVYANVDDEELGEIMFGMSEFVHDFDSIETVADHLLTVEEDSKTIFSARMNAFFHALKSKYQKELPILPAISSFIDSELRKNNINLDITKILKRIYIEFDPRKPLLIVESGALDTWWLLAKLTLKNVKKKPQLLVMGAHLTDDEINMNLNNCKLSGRWIILQGLHNQLENLYRIKFPETSNKFMICATIPRNVVLPEFVLSQFRLQSIDLPNTTAERIEALIYLVAEEHEFEENLKRTGYKPFLACVILFHVKILESDKKDDYSDLEFRLLLDTFDKFMRRDIHIRYKYLTRMASIIYQVEDLGVLDDIAGVVSEFELESEFDRAFSTKKADTKSMIMKWGQELSEVDKFLRQITELYKTMSRDVKSKASGSIDLRDLINQLKKLL